MLSIPLRRRGKAGQQLLVRWRRSRRGTRFAGATAREIFYLRPTALQAPFFQQILDRVVVVVARLTIPGNEEGSLFVIVIIVASSGAGDVVVVVIAAAVGPGAVADLLPLPVPSTTSSPRTAAEAAPQEPGIRRGAVGGAGNDDAPAAAVDESAGKAAAAKSAANDTSDAGGEEAAPSGSSGGECADGRRQDRCLPRFRREEGGGRLLLPVLPFRHFDGSCNCRNSILAITSFCSPAQQQKEEGRGCR